MNAIQELTGFNFIGWVMGAFLLLAAIIAGVEIISKFSVIIGKPIGIKKQRDEDHTKLCNLESHHDEDIKELKRLINAVHDEVTAFTGQFSNNREHDREQSRGIQKELTTTQKQQAATQEELLSMMKDIVQSNSQRDEQIASLIIAQKEMLAEKINEKYKYYISINGIPEDEYDEFVALHHSYNMVGGNHHGDAKFNYCVQHLPVIPVTSNIAKRDKFE